MPRFRHIHVHELEAYGNSEAYGRLPTVPITFSRIASQVQNPRASMEDLALIVAEEESGEVLGFIGLLPDYLFTPERQKVYWISCWWTDTERGKNLGIPLLYAAYKHSEGRLLADSIPDTLPIFEKSKLFHIPSPKKGLRLFLQPCFRKIVSRRGKLGPFGPAAVHWAEKWAKRFFAPVIWFNKKKRKYPDSFAVTSLPSVDEKTAQFIRSQSTGEPFQREKEEMNWILRFPWLTVEKKGTPFYPFSQHVDSFASHLIHLSKDGVLHAFFFFTEREGSFKLPYVYFEPKYILEVTQCIEAFLYEKGAEEFTCFHPILSDALHSRFPFAYHHRLSYQYVWGKDLPLDDAAAFQDGDGDAIFT